MEKTEFQSGLVSRQAEPAEPSYIGATSAFGDLWDNPLVTTFDHSGRTAFRLELAASTF
jgi:hypothetical protein